MKFVYYESNFKLVKKNGKFYGHLLSLKEKVITRRKSEFMPDW